MLDDVMNHDEVNSGVEYARIFQAARKDGGPGCLTGDTGPVRVRFNSQHPPTSGLHFLEKLAASTTHFEEGSAFPALNPDQIPGGPVLKCRKPAQADANQTP
jgi:hypothetical protein